MRTLVALIVAGLFLMPGCAYLEDDAVVEDQIVADLVQRCTDETAENYNQSAERRRLLCLP